MINVSPDSHVAVAITTPGVPPGVVHGSVTPAVSTRFVHVTLRQSAEPLRHTEYPIQCRRRFLPQRFNVTQLKEPCPRFIDARHRHQSFPGLAQRELSLAISP